MNADTNSSKNGSKTKYSVQYLDQQTANCVKRTALLEHLTVFFVTGLAVTLSKSF